MSDQCKHCICRGDMDACFVAPCSIRESWFAILLLSEAVRLQSRVRRLEDSLRSIANGPMENWFNWTEIAEEALKEKP